MFDVVGLLGGGLGCVVAVAVLFFCICIPPQRSGGYQPMRRVNARRANDFLSHAKPPKKSGVPRICKK